MQGFTDESDEEILFDPQAGLSQYLIAASTSPSALPSSSLASANESALQEVPADAEDGDLTDVASGVPEEQTLEGEVEPDRDTPSISLLAAEAQAREPEATSSNSSKSIVISEPAGTPQELGEEDGNGIAGIAIARQFQMLQMRERQRSEGTTDGKARSVGGASPPGTGSEESKEGGTGSATVLCTPADALRSVGVDPDEVFQKLCNDAILAGFKELAPEQTDITRDNVTAAISHIALSSSSAPDDLRLQSSLGHALFRLQLHSDAAPHLQSAISLFEGKYGSRLDYQRKRRELQLLRRQRKATGGDARPSAEERAMYDDGKSAAAAHVNLGLVLHTSGGGEGVNDDAAAEHFQAAVELDRHEPAAHTHWAQLLEKRGDYLAALHHFEAALKLDPNDVIALTRCGSIYDQQRQYDKARAYLERAIAVNDSFESAHFALALCLSRGDRHREAIPHLRKTVELAPENGSAWLSLGIALEAAREFEEGFACIEKAVQLDPRSKFGQHTYKKSQKTKAQREQAARQLAHLERARSQQRKNSPKVRKAKAVQLCAVCDKEGTNCCARCKKAYYCGGEHQRAHWKAGHNKECLPS